jgi:lipoyl(octanoyl) transferase
MRIHDLGLMHYRAAWAAQEDAHEQVLAGGEEALLLVEHPPVITFGRRPGGERNLLTPEPQLASMGVELVQSDRGGDVTFHGPGQIVAYPIVRLADHGLSVSGYVHALERIVISTLSEFGIRGQLDPSAIGVWVDVGGKLSKICALGVRIRRGVSLHGIALNVDTDLRYFNLIVPCGLVERPVTSVRQILGARGPTITEVRQALSAKFRETFVPGDQPNKKNPSPLTPLP